MRTSFVGLVSSSGGLPGAPGAIRNLVATAAFEGADVTWDAPISNGGSAITDYELQFSLTNIGGTRDTAFTTNTGTGFNDRVYSIAIQSDGKIICGGSFTTFNGTTTQYIARLNADGTLDTAFNANASPVASGAILSVAIQSDGKIVCGGVFTAFGTTVNRIVRLNTDGTRDTTFTTNTGTAFNNDVRSIAIQSDGKIICGGSFTTFNGTTVNRIVRLNADGTLDTTFTTNTGTAFNNDVRSIAIQSDGKIVCGGDFTTLNSTSKLYIARLNANGVPDTAFAAGIFINQTVSSVAIQVDGKIVISGSFTEIDGTNAVHIARLNTDGTVDTAFAANTLEGFTSGWPFVVAIQSDGKIICGGDFTGFNETTTRRIARLNADGTLDTTFTANAGTAMSSEVEAIAIQSDGKIVCGGNFSSFNGATVNRIVRLNGDEVWSTTVSNGVLDTSYSFTGLIGGTGYLFRVRAVNSIGNGPYVQTSSPVTAIAPTAPSVAITYYSKDAVISPPSYYTLAIGTLNPNGASTTVVLEHRIVGAPTWSISNTVASFNYDPVLGPFAGITELEIVESTPPVLYSEWASANYEARFVATNAYGTTTSSILQTGV